MNKKLFMGATVVTATVVGGLVYYRHTLLDYLNRKMYTGLEEELHPTSDPLNLGPRLEEHLTTE